MIITVAAVAALVLPILLGGSALRMATVQLRHTGWVLAALGVQVLIIELLTGPEALLEGAHIATYVVALAFLVVNSRVPGLWLVALGTLSNGLTIALNGGTLPARAGALATAGLDVDGARFVNSGVIADPKLPWLGDVFAIPASLPLANVFSVGDVFIVTGVAVAAWRVCGTRWTRPWSPPRHRLDGRRPRGQRVHARHLASLASGVAALPAQRRPLDDVGPAAQGSSDPAPAAQVSG